MATPPDSTDPTPLYWSSEFETPRISRHCLTTVGISGPGVQLRPPSCPADLDGDCAVGISDFLILLANWS